MSEFIPSRGREVQMTLGEIRAFETNFSQSRAGSVSIGELITRLLGCVFRRERNSARSAASLMFGIQFTRSGK